jgi:hypothetical protein
VLASLRSVDTSYASGNAAEAQTKFEQARSAWNKVAPAISAREAREAQLLFDSLGKKLQASAPATDVKSTVSGMLEELNDDIARELIAAHVRAFAYFGGVARQTVSDNLKAGITKACQSGKLLAPHRLGVGEARCAEDGDKNLYRDDLASKAIDDLASAAGEVDKQRIEK